MCIHPPALNWKPSVIVKLAAEHRVLVGPFVSREQLAVAQQQLAKNGFNNLLLQQRKGR